MSKDTSAKSDTSTAGLTDEQKEAKARKENPLPVSYTHLRAHETVLDIVCRLLLEKKKKKKQKKTRKMLQQWQSHASSERR